MDTSESLASIAEVAVTLVGFAAVFRAFRGETADSHSGARTLLVIENGLILVLLCYLPTLLTEMALEPALAYRVVAGATALYWIRWLVLAFRLRNAVHATPYLFRAAVVNHVAIFAINGANALPLGGPPDVIYLLSAVAILVQIGIAFLAQFRAESIQLPDPGEPVAR